MESKQQNAVTNDIYYQVIWISQLYDLDSRYAVDFIKKLPDMEGIVPKESLAECVWTAIPSYSAMMKFGDQSKTLGQHTYMKAVARLFEMLSTMLPLENELKSRSISIERRTVDSLQKIGESQSGEIYVVPTQIGYRHRGHNACQAVRRFADNEFGLGLLTLGSLLLSNLLDWNTVNRLLLYCLGDECHPQYLTPFICHWDDEIIVGEEKSLCKYKMVTSPTGFMPLC